MAKLNAKKRNALLKADFAAPGRKYPVNDASHARNALARVAQDGSPKEKAEVRAKVHEKFPGIGDGGSMKKGSMKKAGSKGGGMKKPMGESGNHMNVGSHAGYTVGMKKK